MWQGLVLLILTFTIGMGIGRQYAFEPLPLTWGLFYPPFIVVSLIWGAFTMTLSLLSNAIRAGSYFIVIMPLTCTGGIFTDLYVVHDKAAWESLGVGIIFGVSLLVGMLVGIPIVHYLKKMLRD